MTSPLEAKAPCFFWPNWPKAERGLAQTLREKDANGLLRSPIGLAHASRCRSQALTAGYGVMAVEGCELLKVFEQSHVDSRPSTTGQAE